MTLPLNTHENQYVFGRGKIYVDIFDSNGNPQGERFLGNCPGFTLTVASEKFEHFASTSGLRKKDLTVTTSVNFNSTINCDDVSAKNLALFFGGSVTDITQSSTPVTGESITVHPGLEYQLGMTSANPAGVRGVTGITVMDATDTTTYVKDTDYTEDEASGRIAIIDGGGISDGDEIHVGYTPNAGTLQRVSSGSSGSLTGAVRFIADNATGENRNCYIASSSLAANGDLPLITENDLAAFAIDVGVNERDSNTPAIIIDGEVV